MVTWVKEGDEFWLYSHLDVVWRLSWPLLPVNDIEREAGKRDKDSSKVFCSEYQKNGFAIFWNGEDCGSLNQRELDAHFHHFYFEMSIRPPNGDIEKAAEYTGLEFKGVYQTGNVNLKIINRWIAVKIMELD